MNQRTYAVATTLAFLAVTDTAIAQSTSANPTAPKTGGVVTTSPEYSKSMEQLQRAAQRLRESIQALAQQPPGPKRDEALRGARDALYSTQQAMIQMPPELRQAPPGLRGGMSRDQAASMKKLQQAADRLYSALHAMAAQPGGERRNDAIQQAREALFDTEQAMLTVPNTAEMQKAEKAQQSRDKSAPVKGPVVVIFPPLLAIDTKFSNGCWATLYDEENYKGEVVTLTGPGDFANLKMSYANILRKWESISVGPKATVTTYDNDDFTQAVATFKPGQRIADLDDKLSMFQNIRSVRIICAK